MEDKESICGPDTKGFLKAAAIMSLWDRKLYEFKFDVNYEH